MNGAFIHNGILDSNIFYYFCKLRKRSFELVQNVVKYRISLVSKSLPIKLKYFVSY